MFYKTTKSVRPLYIDTKQWTPVHAPLSIARSYSFGKLFALHTLDFFEGWWWDHLSISHKDRLPTWDELVAAKEAFFGTEREAIQFIPRRNEYVNLHKNCLHIWAKNKEVIKI